MTEPASSETGSNPSPSRSSRPTGRPHDAAPSSELPSQHARPTTPSGSGDHHSTPMDLSETGSPSDGRPAPSDGPRDDLTDLTVSNARNDSGRMSSETGSRTGCGAALARAGERRGGEVAAVQTGGRGQGVTVSIGAAVVVAVALVVAVSVTVGDRAYLDQGLPYPGGAAAATYALLRLIACLAGGFTLGSLAYALFCAAPTGRGRMGVDGYAAGRIAERAAMVWALSAIALVPVTAADAAGMSLGTAVRLRALPPLIEAAEKPKAWLVVAVLTVAVAVLLRLTLSWNSLFGLAGISAVAVISPAVVGNAGEGPNHDYATGAVIPFTIALSLLAGLSWNVLAQRRRVGGPESTGRFRVASARYRVIVAAAVAVMIPTSLVLMLILDPPSAFGGIYSWLALGAALLLAAHLALIWWLGRAASESPLLPVVLAVAVATEVVWLGISIAMAIQPAPAFANRSFTALQVFLGFDLPHPPDVWRLFTVWRFDVVLGTAAILLAAAYLAGARRLRHRGDDWPRWRTLAWTVGCLALLLVTSSGIGAYGYGMFSVHMMTHMALNMFIPVLLVLGAPVTLLLRAVPPAGRSGQPGPREWVLSLMHSRFTLVLSNPIVSLIIFVVSLYGLYFTALFDQLIRFHWGHLLMNIHFLITGYLYYWAIIGIDPGPKRLPHLGRLGMLFAIMPFHAFFGVAVMSSDTLIGADFYPQLQLGWMHDLLADQRLGGTLAWISGEVPVLLVVGALLSQWAKQERKEAARFDRHQEEYPEDDELAAYNAMLDQLSARRR